MMDIKEILKKHLAWLRNEENGKRAVLTDAILTGAVLADADLRAAVLTNADPAGSVLRGADLRGAVLTRTFLTDADLTDTDLGGSKGLLTAREFMGKFKHDKLGVIVY